jgi:hypothetical protein
VWGTVEICAFCVTYTYILKIRAFHTIGDTGFHEYKESANTFSQFAGKHPTTLISDLLIRNFYEPRFKPDASLGPGDGNAAAVVPLAGDGTATEVVSLTFTA